MTHADRHSTLAIGIGSPHGDDRAGWEVIERLSECDIQPLELRKAAVPHDILDWLQCASSTHIVDACSGGIPQVCRYVISKNAVGTLHLAMTDAASASGVELAISQLRSGSSHQFDLWSTLKLAAVLNRLPMQVVLWTVPVISAEKNTDLQAITLARVEACAARICQELLDA